jgi:transposase
MWPGARALTMSVAERRDLERLLRAHAGRPRVVRRIRVVLAAAEGAPNRAIARRLGVSRPTVLLWRARFAVGGAAALVHEAPRPGRPRRLSEAKVEAIVRATLQTLPHPARRWSVRGMAAAHGVSPATVQRIWKARGLQPHLMVALRPPEAQAPW